VGFGLRIFEECALGSEGDDGVADTFGEEGVGGTLGACEVGDGDSGECGGPGLVGGDVVDVREDAVGQRSGGGGVQDRWNSEGVGERQAMVHDRDGELQLRYGCGGAGDEGTGGVDLRCRHFEACAGNDDDGVLSGLGVDDDGRSAGGAVGVGEKLRVDAFDLVEVARHLAEGIGAELGDEAYFATGAGSGYRLVGAFATGAELNAGAMSVSPHAGMRVVRKARSATKLPMTVIHFAI